MASRKGTRLHVSYTNSMSMTFGHTAIPAEQLQTPAVRPTFPKPFPQHSHTHTHQHQFHRTQN